jgi:predicted dehydrogenase
VLKVGLIGAGGAGQKRAAAVAAHEGCELVAVCDSVLSLAEQVAAAAGARAVESWESVVEDGALDVIIVSTTHDMLSPISVAALRAGKHVLCEKPMGRTYAEVSQVLEAATIAGRLVAGGYNHRYLPAIADLQRVVASGDLGAIDFIRGCYGHGGRPGYDKEWRGDPEKSGGGELLDQGAHLIDLCLWLLGEFQSVTGHTTTRFWDIAPLEDNAFGLFRSASGQVASIHVSWTQWKNLFSLEVFGRDGYAQAEGRGGSYGPQRFVLGRRRAEGGAPEEEVVEYGDQDESWSLEWRTFVTQIEADPAGWQVSPAPMETMAWISRLYSAAREARVVTADEMP